MFQFCVSGYQILVSKIQFLDWLSNTPKARGQVAGPETFGFSHAVMLVVIFTVESSWKCLYFQENSRVGKKDPD